MEVQRKKDAHFGKIKEKIEQGKHFIKNPF
jgi:hypothetical protein